MDGHSKPLARVLAPFLASLLFFTIAALARTSIAAAGIVEAVTERGLPSEETVSPVISPREGTSIPPSAVAAAPEPALLRLSPTRLQKNIIVGEYTSVDHFLKKERDDGDLPGYFATVSGLACRAAVESFLRAYKETRFAEESLAPNGGVEQHRATWISDLLPSTRVKRKFSLMKQQGRIFLTDVRLMNIIFHIKAVTARLLRGWSGQRLFKNQAASFGYSVTCRNDCANEITKHLSESHVAPTTTRKALKTDRDFATTVSCVQNDWRHTILWNTGC
ncbi:conserved hypothetical protein [Neospora caninum Liverpool]|uniref:Transmembrane protein n=1 Tax=Neospora caninum (strain Liverpool) TaxID=572307 RepID=F0VMK6_NEOCL|nr:conserved hypothetical protein [Neospora caninum Liverpool]CBZ54952.1 conserved hypothetical protein [Neospora caninum Liverpool]|eukprot:XP_003884980.1 conserved hypothetical protein [Neospora caninum Liverpool]